MNGTTRTSSFPFLLVSGIAIALGGGWLTATGCGGDEVLFGEPVGGAGGTSTSTSTSTSTTGTGGNTSTSTSGTGGSGGTSGCAVDCSQIDTMPCQEGVCNEDTGECEVANADEGEACDDGLFCTVDTVCSAGVCAGGSEYNCGWTPGPCDLVTCNEDDQNCSLGQKPNGSPCVSDDLCQENATCTNGSCSGQEKDCFFHPVPNECHVPVCDPQTGNCIAVPGNEGQSCTDPSDLCTVNKTCAAGSCQGGQPLDCSYLDQGCVMGACNVNTGQCISQPVPNGGPCDDSDPCTTGETCTNGNCTGGTAITQCVGNDYCCPSNCNVNNDPDCAITAMDIGPHATSFANQYSARGYWFQAPVGMTIHELRVPEDASTAPQHVQVVRFNNGPPPNYPQSTTNFVTLAYQANVAGNGWIQVNIPVQAGQYIGVIGARGSGTTLYNSYGPSNTYATTIFGQATTLHRLIAYVDLPNNQATSMQGHTQNQYGRIELRYGP